VRITFKTQPQDSEWAPIEAIWRAADEIPELDGGWLFDHFYPIMTDDPAGPCFEGWTALAYLAGVTERLRLGLMVSGNTYRHPALLAKMCATIDVMSKGRLEIGLGAAWNALEHEAYGIDFPPLGKRMDALDEACQVIDFLLTKPVSDFDGVHYQLKGAFCEPKPVQKPRPPLVIGGGGEKRTLRIAAKYADQWNFPGRTAEELKAKLSILHQHCAEVGRNPEEIEVSVHLFEPLEPISAAATARGLAAAGCTHVILYLKAPYNVERLRTIAHAVADAVG
jgi:F420-dependent oxidoreductase-like protein